MTTNALPPGPRSALPQLFHLKDPFPLFDAVAREWADPVAMPMLGAGSMVLTWKPENVKAIFAGDPDAFVPGANEAMQVILGTGSLFTMAGAPHKRARKLLAPPFHGERMRAYGALIRETTQRWIAPWKAGERFVVLDAAQGITLDVIIEALFGERDRARIDALHADILAMVAAFNPMVAFRFMQRDFGGLGPWASFQRKAKALEARLSALVEEKRRTPGDDILSMLLATKGEDGDALSEREVFEQMVSFIVAGHETTATSIAWAMYHLHRHPGVLERVRAELAKVGDAPEAIAKAPLLEASIHEALRLTGPVPLVARKLVRDFALEQYTLPAGSTVAVASYLAHRRPETYSDPLAYRPERFLERAYGPFELMPFGGGARRCLGAAFAMYELKIALATILSSGRYRLEEPKPVRNVFRIATFGAETGIRMTREK